MRVMLTSVALALCLSACDFMTVRDPTPSPSMPENPQAAVQEDARLYREYKEGVVGNGQESVLFFHAAWCPICKNAEEAIVALEAEGGIDVPVYKVDFDTETALRSRYGVVTQHTFVRIDGNGGVLSVDTGLSNEALLQVLSAS